MARFGSRYLYPLSPLTGPLYLVLERRISLLNLELQRPSSGLYPRKCWGYQPPCLVCVFGGFGKHSQRHLPRPGFCMDTRALNCTPSTVSIESSPQPWNTFSITLEISLIKSPLLGNLFFMPCLRQLLI